MYSTLERFLKYVTFDTQSAEGSPTVPSTLGQFELAKRLVKELEELGLSDIKLSPHAYVTASLPANTDKKIPSIGFIAHMDTATELTGKDVKPRIVWNYDGGDIVLNERHGVILSPDDFPMMRECVGQDLVVTDGMTLLGADNKAGIAEIMGALQHLIEHPEISHGDVKIAFTPDEEVSHRRVEVFVAGFAD